MRKLIILVSVFLLISSAFAQTNDNSDKNAKVKDELRKLFAELNEAWRKRDRKALEKIYADEFIFIHGSGYVDNKSVQITEGLTVDVYTPIPTPTFDDLHVYSDVAVLRNDSRPIGANFYGTTIYAKKDGRWQIAQIQGTMMLPERKAVKVDAIILDSYVGKYESDTKQTLTVVREGVSLTLQITGVPKRTLVSTSDVQFFSKRGDEINFRKDDSGKVTHFTIRWQSGQERIWKKVE